MYDRQEPAANESGRDGVIFNYLCIQIAGIYVGFIVICAYVLFIYDQTRGVFEDFLSWEKVSLVCHTLWIIIY